MQDGASGGGSEQKGEGVKRGVQNGGGRTGMCAEGEGDGLGVPVWAVPAGNVVVTVGEIPAGFVVPIGAIGSCEHPAVFEVIFYVTGSSRFPAFDDGNLSDWVQRRSEAKVQFEFEPSLSECSVVPNI